MAKKRKDIQIRQRTEKAWEKSYAAYEVAREKKLADGIALEPKMSMDTFKAYYSDNYEIHKKSIIRDIIEGEVLISYKQGKTYEKSFKNAPIEEWIKKARAEGTIISEDIEKKLLKLPDAGAKSFRSAEFRALYDELFPFIQKYNQSDVKKNMFTEVISLANGSPKKRRKRK